ncbi:MAG: nucleotidyltransferase [Pseudanabaena frigida]|uniref:Nucleotidyltransferase n=1 Tax=Pseudanabaena frigida TaxID=945775 RepID=A0A2W4Y5K0_9CYAN|nr:MAG: nucleotidyltransferase [Pseudanabaena frigida]
MSKTAVELTLHERKAYFPARNLDSLQDAARWTEAWQVVQKIAVLLRDRYRTKQIIVFGSLTNKERFTRHSDIDLAISGLTFKQFYQAVDDIELIARDFKVDLVNLDRCRQAIAERINREGIVI